MAIEWRMIFNQSILKISCDRAQLPRCSERWVRAGWKQQNSTGKDSQLVKRKWKGKRMHVLSMWRNFSLNLWRKRNLAWLEKTTEWCIDSASAITLGSCSMPHSEDSGSSAETLGWLNLFLCHWGNGCAILGKIKNGCIYTVWAWNYSVAYLERQYYKHLNILSPENLWSSILHQSITLGILPLGISRGSMRYWPTLEKEHWAKGRGEVIKHGQQMGKNKLCTGRKQSTIHWK